ncbi:zinc-dependent metalloprotease [Tropicibacter sp. R16_0]|uniref:zinc-dependent metalloprotease n=1 Tax=Tropicibacter sp. R16_0 TaxID=2821102 RepID=UPI001ADB9573|nr:zinc-dependent metalloprotease [Tropicibacter sp. R16_0]MBO9453037.1 zinc-dependent metalloprotease [Tropicibacter sp. R16_0]
MKTFITTFAALFCVGALPALANQADHECMGGSSGDFLPLQIEESTGRVLMEIHDLSAEALYFPYGASSPAAMDVFLAGAVAGGGSLGLDEDFWGYKAGLVRFERVGQQVALELRNRRFREVGRDPIFGQLLEDQVSTSILAMLPVVHASEECLLIDTSPLSALDAGGHALQAQIGGGQTVALDPTRSFVDMKNSEALADHTEVQTVLTFANPAPSAALNRVIPDAKSMTIRVRHAFVRPPEGMRPRVGHPLIASGNFGAIRVNFGTIGIAYFDTAAAADEPRRVHLVNRFRLEKSDPSADVSDPINPITVYLDPRIPEPYMNAIRDAALDWGDAFEVAGYSNAIRVEVADESVDPLDVRTNYVFWSEDETRSVAQGETFLDQETGEILSFKVRIDSHRPQYHANMWAMMRSAIDPDDPGEIRPSQEEYAAYRIRMLSLHEIGHGLGLGHNMSASVAGQSSIMDYVMAPRFDITDAGKLSFAEWHTQGIGPYDLAMIRYLYTPFSESEEAEGLNAIIEDMRAQGLILTTEADARWNEYDDYADPVEQLDAHMAQRNIMLANFGERSVNEGDFYGRLRDNFQFAYYYHRTALDRGVKNIGGFHEDFTRRGETGEPFTYVDADTQRAVLERLMAALRPEALAISPEVIALIGPQPERMPPSTDEIIGRSGSAVDTLSAARSLAAAVVGPLMAPDRAQRLMIQYALDDSQLSLAETIDVMITSLVNATPPEVETLALLQSIVADETATALTALSGNANASPEVRAVAASKLAEYEISGAPASSALPRPKAPAN